MRNYILYFLLFFCTIVTLSVVTISVADDSLIGQWSFDNDSPRLVQNSVNEQFCAKISPELPRVDGVYGKAVDLSGQYQIEIPADFIPSGLTELTLTVWIAPRKFDVYNEIFRKEDVNGPVQNRILFSFQNSGHFLSFGLTTGGNYAECDAVIAPEEFLDGNWHFIAATFDSEIMHIYLDGNEIGNYQRQSRQIDTSADFRPIKKYWSYEYNPPNVKKLDEATINAPAFIGSYSGQNEFFNGKLDDFRFYNRALSSGEIKTAFIAGKTLPNNVLKNAEEAAKKHYVKRDSYQQTLLATRENVVKADNFDTLTGVALHRILRNDYPSEVNAYLIKYQQSPTAMMTWNTEQLRNRAKQLETAYTEYLPLTDHQWQLLSDTDRLKWQQVKKFHTAYQQNEGNLYEIVLDMENIVENRPHVSEAVAPYQTPETPPVKNRTDNETQKLLEKEWLFQCNGKPTVERSLQEIGWAKDLAARIIKQYPTVDLNTELKQLKEFETQAQTLSGDDQDLYIAVRRTKREIMFKNPVIDFDSLIYVDSPLPQGSESHHETRHRLGYMAVPGGRLMRLKGLNPGGHQTQLMPQKPLHGSFWRPDLSYDANKVLVGFKPHNEKNFHIYEINIDGSGERQLTAGIFDDFDPVYLPDGKNFMFLTTRGHIYVRCMPPTNAFVLARMALNTKPGDKNLYIISRNGEPEYTPSVMSDGRVIYTRWEYTDKPLWRAQSLWTMNTDGTQVQTFWGNQSVWPDLLKDARSIPGSERVMFTGSAHHNWFSGSVGIIDPGKGFNFPDGLTKVTQEVVWPESGNGSVDPKESENYHLSGNYVSYYSPYPLSEKDFLVSARRVIKNSQGKDVAEKFVLLLMDTDGNRELVFEGEHHLFDAQPIRPRIVPQIASERVEWPSWAERDKPNTGIIYSNNVYENAPEELRNKAKYLRIWSIEHKTYTYWYKRNYVSSGPEISVNQSEGVKKIIGTVPIEDDGSVSFTAPSGIALHFQLLDKNQLALQTMKSFTGVLPRETRGCLGCHESMTRSPVTAQTGKALKRAPSEITPVSWNDITVSYERYVQPVLDQYCGECHQNPDHKAYKKFNAVLRPGFLGFKEPYMTLMGSPTWGAPYKTATETEQIGGFGWADTILVEAYDQRDPAAYATYPPMKKLSYKSRLIHRMMSGQHNNIKVTGDDLLRVILWVDAMGPYYGAEEVRCMEDPIFQGKDWISQPPRIMTAPMIQRPGPFDPFFTDSAYETPNPIKYNTLPVGVVRSKP
ncbi:MAG: hypothetical protein LBC20_09510 [Planctomycetaceae bacterium]|jgi:hypothetical protein|nr:hypothetical protein [Planctomycetaceae bacterium]